MKPDIENSIPKKDEISLEVSMLSEEAFRLEKQRKQEELIKRANEQLQDETIEIIPKPRNEIIPTSPEDYITAANLYLKSNNIEPLKESEVQQIMALINDFSGFSFKKWILTGKIGGGTIKNYIRLGRISTILKETIFPRIRNAFKEYINKSGENYSE